jgi:molybdate transport repressor ModE-like protein
MRTGAVIAAAGITKDGKSFDPLTAAGGVSAVQRIAAVLSQAGVNRIVFITGHNRLKLEKALADCGVVTLYNERYRSCDMRGSVNIGLDFLLGKCGRLLVLPASAAFFSAETAGALLSDGSDITRPVYDGRKGHPIALSAEAARRILRISDAETFDSAVAGCGIEPKDLAVSDMGIVSGLSGLTEEPAILDCHNSSILRPEMSLAVVRETSLIDEKSAALLELIEEFHSVSRACRGVQVSYSSAWAMLKNMEAQAGCQLVSRVQGGAVGGGRSGLTPEGRRLLELYVNYREELQTCAGRLYDKYFGGEYVRRIYLVCAGETLSGAAAASFASPEELPLSTFGKLQSCLLWRELSDKGIDEVLYAPHISCRQTAQIISDSALPLDSKLLNRSDCDELSSEVKRILMDIKGNAAIVLARDDAERFLSELFGSETGFSEIRCGSYAILTLDGSLRLRQQPAAPHPELGQILCTRMLNAALADEHTIREKIKFAESRVNEAFCRGDDSRGLGSAVMLSEIVLSNGQEKETSSQWLRRLGYDCVARRIDSAE